MKLGVSRISDEQRQRVITLRRNNSLSKVSELVGLPLGTVKTILSRSGRFKDNPKHRAMFTLPEEQKATSTQPATLDLPPQQVVTGDKEVDALLWLRAVISTGQAGLIERAMEAAKRIETPFKELEKRYHDYLHVSQPGNFFATFGAIGFADLDSLAKKSIMREQRRCEALARFGDAIFDDTRAEVFCTEMLRGLDPRKYVIGYDKHEAAERFKQCPEYLPNTLADCLYELDYWSQLYRLRNAYDSYYDTSPESSARERFIFGLLAEIRPRNRDEAKAVLKYMRDHERTGMDESDDIMDNLLM
jgi:hypothetical protein